MSQMENFPVELESQIILRLPENPALALREALRGGSSNLKDRLKLRMEPDMRKGTLYFDHYMFSAKLLDLPCIMESHKTMDRKTIYKTADICQMLVCTEGEEPEEEPTKPQKPKRDFKVDKKYLFPHGITPPLKNVRKRRFRKILRKKQYSDQPEIEKEVRRLLRTDYEAKHVSWEVIDAEEDKSNEGGGGKDVLMHGSKTNEEPSSGGNTSRIALELFGGALSDSDAEEDGGDEESRMSMLEDDDSQSQSHRSDSVASTSQDTGKKYATSFSREMFQSTSKASTSEKPPRSSHHHHHHKRQSRSSTDTKSMSQDALKKHLDKLKQQLTEVSARRQIQETELSTIDNVALKGRLERVLDKLAHDQNEKEKEIRDVEALLAEAETNE